MRNVPYYLVLLAGISPMVGCSATRIPERHDTIFLRSGGLLNGQGVDEKHDTITVKPGQVIVGTINARVLNAHDNPGAVVPLAATVTWGERTTQPWIVEHHVSQGWHELTVPINLTAPPDAGTYYIVIANAGEFNEQQIMSSTNGACPSPVWNDGNDLGWDWTKRQFQVARKTGFAASSWLRKKGYGEGSAGATWVRIVVRK